MIELQGTIHKKAFQTYEWSIFLMIAEESQMLNRVVNKHLKKSKELILNEHLKYGKL